MKRNKWDAIFSKYIRARDGWKCQRCGTIHPQNSQGLHCSHYHSRGKLSTRFDEDNCQALCYGCHRYLDSHKEEHTKHKLKMLGQERLDALNERANTPAKKKDIYNDEFYRKIRKDLTSIIK